MLVGGVPGAGPRVPGADDEVLDGDAEARDELEAVVVLGGVHGALEHGLAAVHQAEHPRHVGHAHVGEEQRAEAAAAPAPGGGAWAAINRLGPLFGQFFARFDYERNFSSENGPKNSPKCPKFDIFACILFPSNFCSEDPAICQQMGIIIKKSKLCNYACILLQRNFGQVFREKWRPVLRPNKSH